MRSQRAFSIGLIVLSFLLSNAVFGRLDNSNSISIPVVRDSLKSDSVKVRKNVIYTEDLLSIVYERNFSISNKARIGLRVGIVGFGAVLPTAGLNIKLGTFKNSFYIDGFILAGGGGALAGLGFGYFYTADKGFALKLGIATIEGGFLPIIGLGYAF